MTRTKKPSIKEHLQKIGADRFNLAYDRAMYELKLDSHFVGLSHLRDEIAYEAALRATGYPHLPFTPSKGCGAMVPETMNLINELLPRATAAAAKGIA